MQNLRTQFDSMRSRLTIDREQQSLSHRYSTAMFVKLVDNWCRTEVSRAGCIDCKFEPS